MSAFIVFFISKVDDQELKYLSFADTELEAIKAGADELEVEVVLEEGVFVYDLEAWHVSCVYCDKSTFIG